MQIKNLKDEFLRFFYFGIIAGISFLIDFFFYFFLIKIFSVFISNIISSFIGITLDYFLSTSKKINLFYVNDKKKYNFYVVYILYIVVTILGISYAIDLLNSFINKPMLSKIVFIPLSFLLNYLFFYISFKKIKWTIKI